MPNIKNEILSGFSNEDYDFAFRRLLDFSRDSETVEWMQRAIRLSGEYRRQGTVEIGQVISLAEEIEKTLLQKKVQPGNCILRTRDMTKTYTSGGFTLYPINVELCSGEILGIVGQNGHGKTTFLECISGKQQIDSGEIDFPMFHHRDYYDLKHSVAFIPQRIPRWYGKLKDNLHFNAAISEVYNSENELLVQFMLERLNLNKYAALTWDQISSGYRTRFEIARVLLQKPTLLILDEPLANLDIQAQETLLTDLRFITKSAYHPLAVILSSQQLHEVEKVADNVLLIKEGRCVFQTAQGTEQGGVVVELQTSMDKEIFQAKLGEGSIAYHFNGGFYTLKSGEKNVEEILHFLLSRKVPITYFRDITHSTKRYF